MCRTFIEVAGANFPLFPPPDFLLLLLLLLSLALDPLSPLVVAPAFALAFPILLFFFGWRIFFVAMSFDVSLRTAWAIAFVLHLFGNVLGGKKGHVWG